MTMDSLICRSRENPLTDVVSMLLDCCMWVFGDKNCNDVYFQMKTIACMTVPKVVDYSTYCSCLVMDWLQAYDFNSREFKETFSHMHLNFVLRLLVAEY